MKVLHGLRVILTLFVAALLPIEVGHCALTPSSASAVAIESEHHDDGDHGCCPESAPPQEPTSPTEPCCCGFAPLPATTAPASISVDAPTPAPTALAIVPMVSATVHARSAFVRLEPDVGPGAPSDPSTSLRSPRGPPHSA